MSTSISLCNYYKIPKSHTRFSWNHPNNKSVPESHTQFSWRNFDHELTLLQSLFRRNRARTYYKYILINIKKIQSMWKKHEEIQREQERRNFVPNIKLIIKPKPKPTPQKTGLDIFTWEPRHDIKIYIKI